MEPMVAPPPTRHTSAVAASLFAGVERSRSASTGSRTSAVASYSSYPSSTAMSSSTSVWYSARFSQTRRMMDPLVSRRPVSSSIRSKARLKVSASTPTPRPSSRRILGRPRASANGAARGSASACRAGRPAAGGAAPDCRSTSRSTAICHHRPPFEVQPTPLLQPLVAIARPSGDTALKGGGFKSSPGGRRLRVGGGDSGGSARREARVRTRRGSAVTRSWRPGGTHSGTAPNTPPPYEGQIFVARTEVFDSRTGGGPPAAGEIARPRRRGSVNALSSPGLVVLAALAVVEGYAQLDLVPTAASAPPRLRRHRRGGRRRPHPTRTSRAAPGDALVRRGIRHRRGARHRCGHDGRPAPGRPSPRVGRPVVRGHVPRGGDGRRGLRSTTPAVGPSTQAIV